LYIQSRKTKERYSAKPGTKTKMIYNFFSRLAIYAEPFIVIPSLLLIRYRKFDSLINDQTEVFIEIKKNCLN
jgi:hypothetical protein